MSGRDRAGGTSGPVPPAGETLKGVPTTRHGGPPPAPSTRHGGHDGRVRTPRNPMRYQRAAFAANRARKLLPCPRLPLSCEFRTRIAFKIHTIMKPAGADSNPPSFLIPRTVDRFHEISVISSRAFCGRNYGHENRPRPRRFSGGSNPANRASAPRRPGSAHPRVPRGQSGRSAYATRPRQARARMPRDQSGHVHERHKDRITDPRCSNPQRPHRGQHG
jgi:hypothetical protein